jgi:hypothetical protein
MLSCDTWWVSVSAFVHPAIGARALAAVKILSTFASLKPLTSHIFCTSLDSIFATMKWHVASIAVNTWPCPYGWCKKGMVSINMLVFPFLMFFL